MAFSGIGAEVSEKGFPRGWEPRAEDLTSQRVFRVTQLLEAMVSRDWSWDIFKSDRLRYAFHGGIFDNGDDEWEVADDGSVELQSNAINFIERTERGVVTANTSGFTYVGRIPMAQIKAGSNKIILQTYIDRRVQIGGAPTGTTVGTVSFPEIIGLILNSQVPLEAVKQFEAFLAIRASQITPGTFGTSAGASDYTFPRDLGILQDLFVGRDAIITGDLAVLENLNVLGIFTAEGVAVFQALATFQAAVVMESTLNVQGLATFEAQALFQALATFQAAVVMESTLNVQGVFTAEAPAVFQALATFQSLAVFEAAVSFESSVSVEGIATLEDQVRRGLRTITAADTPYTLVETDWHLNVDISLGSVEVLIPDAAAHFSGGFTDQLHFKIIGSGFGEPFVTLTPSVPGQLIDNEDSAILRRDNLSFTLVADGTGWWIQ